MLNDFDLMAIRKVLVRQFGEDMAQHALLNLWEVLSKGVEVNEPMAFCRMVVKREQQDIARKQDGVALISIDPFLAMESGGGTTPDAFLDTRSPESICAAKEILDSMPDVLIDQLLQDEENTALSDVERQRRSRHRRSVKQRI